jgi:hypothetical protein
VAGQLDLFAAASSAPEGLRYQEEFITAADEAELIRRIGKLPLQPFQFGAFEGKRRVASFGFRYDYTERRLQEAEPVPPRLANTAPPAPSAFDGPPVKNGNALRSKPRRARSTSWPVPRATNGSTASRR